MGIRVSRYPSRPPVPFLASPGRLSTASSGPSSVHLRKQFRPALICLEGLSKLGAEQQARQEAAAVYRAALADTPLQPVPEPEWGRSIYFKLPVILPAEHADRRPFMVEAISAENVSCRIPHRPLYEIPWLAKFQ